MHDPHVGERKRERERERDALFLLLLKGTKKFRTWATREARERSTGESKKFSLCVFMKEQRKKQINLRWALARLEQREGERERERKRKKERETEKCRSHL